MPTKKKNEEVVEEKKADYRVIPAEEVADYLSNGYTLVGGAVSKYNCWYQAVVKE